MVNETNEDIKRLKNNIRKLENRILELQNNGQDRNVIDVLNREKFNQQRLICMAETHGESPRPICWDVLLPGIHRKARTLKF